MTGDEMTADRAMREAIALALENVKSGGGPFGCVILKGGEVVGRGANRVTATNDPTAHAEVVAIRAACQALGTFELRGCEVYTSCEPCPMCLGACFWARVDAIHFAGTRDQAAAAGFSDAEIYDEIPRPLDQRRLRIQPLLAAEGNRAFEAWAAQANRRPY